MQLVWLKRDLRSHDHAALAGAVAAAAVDENGPGVASLWIDEPAWRASPEFHPRHAAFARDALAALRSRLAVQGLPLLVRRGDAVAVLEALWDRHRFTHLWSHEETGPGWTYARDLAVARWCRARGVQWHEIPQHGVVRRLRSRLGWAGRWQARMDAAEATDLACQGAVQAWPGLGAGSQDWGDLPAAPDLPDRVPGGEADGLRRLAHFLEGGGRDYRRSLSSPSAAQDGCSRLSAHLAFGSLSLRRVHRATEAAIADAQRSGDRALASGLRGFSGRLRWHCHFMQKLEDEPSIEFRHFARVCDGLRPGEDHPAAPEWGAEQAARLQAWSAGQTGFPMVDACMRSLVATGWLNFRMRAMLVSFASYHLWLHWRPTGLHLARQFTDFEAGIHWSQMQMQSGTTGINTLRIYSPSKQALDQDPQGQFIRQWVPELARVPLSHLAQPWRMDAALQEASGCVLGRDYPAPVVVEAEAMKAAKDAMYGLRKTQDSRQEADRIQSKHGSRKSGLPQTGVRTRRPRAPASDTRQQELFE